MKFLSVGMHCCLIIVRATNGIMVRIDAISRAGRNASAINPKVFCHFFWVLNPKPLSEYLAFLFLNRILFSSVKHRQVEPMCSRLYETSGQPCVPPPVHLRCLVKFLSLSLSLCLTFNKNNPFLFIVFWWCFCFRPIRNKTWTVSWKSCTLAWLRSSSTPSEKPSPSRPLTTGHRYVLYSSVARDRRGTNNMWFSCLPVFLLISYIRLY